MRPRTQDVLAAWALGLAALGALAALLCGCVVSPTAASEELTPVERTLVDDTTRFAKQLEVDVRGVITTTMHPGLAHLNPTAWYEAGLASYYRPNVALYVRLVPEQGCATAADVAAHEVAHAIYPRHDISHWCCMIHMGVVPTYPPPVFGTTCEGRAARCLR